MSGAAMQYRHIFVLSPGRSGSQTFAEACQHLTNYSAAHESLSSKLGNERFAFPENHIEVDNRLCWFFGEMEKRFDDNETLYINLQRDHSKTVDSFLHRLRNSQYRSSIMSAFAHGIIMKSGDWKAEEELDLASFYVDTVQSNIEHFLRGRRHLVVSRDDGGESFAEFLKEISAEGDLEQAINTWNQVFNAR